MEQIINQLICVCVSELKKDDNQNMLKSDIINPIVDYIGKQIWPYVLFACSLFMVLWVVIVVSLYYIYQSNTIKTTNLI